MLHLRIEGMLDTKIAERIADRVRSEIPMAKVEIGQCITIKGFSTGVEGVVIVGVIASIIQALAAIWNLYEQRRGRTAWTYDRAIGIVRNELAARQITGFTVEAIEGFEHLLARDREPCIWRLKDNASEAHFVLLMFLDGNSYVLQLK
jgi:hypothetical protein